MASVLAAQAGGAEVGSADSASILPITLTAMGVAFAMAVAIGAQDVSNALGTSVGSKAISVKQAVVIGAVCEFLGSLAGGSVAHTISHGILLDHGMSVETFRGVMASTMAGAVVWLFVATWLSLPVSTTHSLIGSLVGIAVFWHGLDYVRWPTIGKTVLSWVISPAMGCLVAWALFFSIRSLVLKAADPAAAVKRWMPWYQGGTAGLLVTFLFLLGPEAYRVQPLVAVLAGLVVTLLGAGVASQLKSGAASMSPGATSPVSSPLPGPDAEEAAPLVTKGVGPSGSANSVAERAFLPLMVVTACVVSFAHGSNDISNAVGPMLAILLSDPAATAAIGYDPDTDTGVPVAVLALGGVGIVVGLAVWGHKVMATVGENITKLTFSRGYAAQVGTALTVLIASVSGISVSTTHCLIGAITGVALADGGGLQSINQATLKKIAASWLITIPAAAFAACLCHSLLVFILGDAGALAGDSPAAPLAPAGGGIQLDTTM